jgi:vacuolar-type H+-ATPase subunit H
MKPTTVELTHGKERISRLSELLACETELADLMAKARGEARRRVEAAREEVERADADHAASLATEAERARREIDDSARARAQALLADARGRVARFDGVSDAEVARLAESALRRLMRT